jgi:hypothetical protein
LRLALLVALAIGPGAALAQAPEGLPAEPPAAEAPAPGALEQAVSLAQDTVERARSLLDQHILVIGAAYREVALRADTSAEGQDAAVFLPEGPSGRGLLGDRVGRTTSLKLDLLSPVRHLGESEVFGWGYNIGLSQVRFDRYESFISDTATSEGQLNGTFAHVIPTLVLSRPQSEDSVVYSRGEMGLGLVAYRITGTMHVRRDHVIPDVYYRETFVGDGKVRYGPALFINTQYILFRRVSLGFTMLVMSYAGYYYTDMGLNAGIGFAF